MSGSRRPRNLRSSRSSASIVTFVSGSAFHQPPSVWSASRRSRPRAGARSAGVVSGVASEAVMALLVFVRGTDGIGSGSRGGDGGQRGLGDARGGERAAGGGV